MYICICVYSIRHRDASTDILTDLGSGLLEKAFFHSSAVSSGGDMLLELAAATGYCGSRRDTGLFPRTSQPI